MENGLISVCNPIDVAEEAEGKGGSCFNSSRITRFVLWSRNIESRRISPGGQMEIRCLARCVFYDSHRCPRIHQLFKLLLYYCAIEEMRGEERERERDHRSSPLSTIYNGKRGRSKRWKSYGKKEREKREREKSCRSIQTDQTGYITYSWRKN